MEGTASGKCEKGQIVWSRECGAGRMVPGEGRRESSREAGRKFYAQRSMSQGGLQCELEPNANMASYAREDRCNDGYLRFSAVKDENSSMSEEALRKGLKRKHVAY